MFVGAVGGIVAKLSAVETSFVIAHPFICPHHCYPFAGLRSPGSGKSGLVGLAEIRRRSSLRGREGDGNDDAMAVARGVLAWISTS